MNYDWLDKLLVTLALCALLSIGMVKLVGPEPVRTTGVILSYMLMGIAIIAVPSFLFAFVTAQINSFKWSNRAKAVSLQRKQVVTAQHKDGVVVGDVAKKHFQNFTGNPKVAAAQAALAKRDETEEEHIGDAIDLAATCDRGMIFGGTRAGKTYFAKAMAKRKLDDGDMVIVLDLKHYKRREPWPEGVLLAGNGDRLEEIGWAFDWIDREVERRGQDFDNVAEYPFVTVIFDELNEALFDQPDFGPRYIRVLRKYSEYRFGVWIMGQSQEVDELGLKGKSSLKACFDAKFDVRYNPTTKERKIEVDFLSKEPVITCPAIQPHKFRKGARPDTDWAFRHDHEGDFQAHTRRHTPPHTHTAAHPGTRKKASGGAYGGFREPQNVSGQPMSRPVYPSMIAHDPDLEPYLFEGSPAGPEIVEVSDPDIARILRSVRQAPKDASIRDLCKATGRTPGGRQAARIKRIIKEHAPRMYRDRFGK